MTDMNAITGERMNINNLTLHVKQHVIAAVTQERAYILPHKALRKIISHYTIFAPKNDDLTGNIAVIPDASVSITCCINQNNSDIHMWGPLSYAKIVENDVKKIPLYLMVEFFPSGANGVFPFSLNLLHNTVCCLDEVDRALSKRITAQLEKCLIGKHASGLDEFFTFLDRVFLQRLERARPLQLIQYVIDALRGDGGVLCMADMERCTGYSARHLNRLVTEKTGMSIKLFARIVRINAACLSMTSPALSLTSLAHSLQYHDQSHFIHDFTAICGVTPGRYLQNMSFFYNEELKFGATFPQK